MSHAITAILLKGSYDKEMAQKYDLMGIPLGFDITMFHIDHYYSACWQKQLGTSGYLETHGIKHACFPNEAVISRLISSISTRANPQYAIILTDYFGGQGEQYANVFEKDQLASKSVTTINQALSFLGIITRNGVDEFETIGLGAHRAQPEYLEKYIGRAEELGV